LASLDILPLGRTLLYKRGWDIKIYFSILLWSCQKRTVRSAVSADNLP
jgi:hypothetical protein